MEKSVWAIASLTLGVACFITVFGMEKALLAIVFGYLGIKEMKANKKLQGKNMAYLGIALGVVSIVLVIVLLPTLWSYAMQMAG